MEFICGLNEIKTGEKARVHSLLTHGAMRRRLLDIGLVEGAEVECVGKSPLGDPSAYLICGAVIAIRDCDSREVKVTGVENGTYR